VALSQQTIREVLMKLARLKDWRESRGLTQKELAEEAHASEWTVTRAEADEEVRPNTARRLAEVLDVTVADLLERPPVPLAEAPQETGLRRKAEAAGAAPPRVSRERLEEHFEDVRPEEVAYLDEVIADLWRLALPDEKPVAHFVPEEVDTSRVWRFLNFVLTTRMFAPEEVERINRGARKRALA